MVEFPIYEGFPGLHDFFQEFEKKVLEPQRILYKPVTVPGMANMQSQLRNMVTEEWSTQVSTSFEQEHKGNW